MADARLARLSARILARVESTVRQAQTAVRSLVRADPSSISVREAQLSLRSLTALVNEVQFAQVALRILVLGPFVTIGNIRVWTGTEFVDVPAKVWTGTAFVDAPVKTWNGSAFV